MSGELVGVGFPGSPVEARMIKGLLESEGIPCLVQSLRGSRTVLVNAVHAEQARTLLAEVEARAEGEADDAESLPVPAPAGAGVRGWVLAFALLGLAFGVFLVVHAI